MNQVAIVNQLKYQIKNQVQSIKKTSFLKNKVGSILCLKVYSQMKKKCLKNISTPHILILSLAKLLRLLAGAFPCKMSQNWGEVLNTKLLSKSWLDTFVHIFSKKRYLRQKCNKLKEFVKKVLTSWAWVRQQERDLLKELMDSMDFSIKMYRSVLAMWTRHYSLQTKQNSKLITIGHRSKV